MFFTQSAKKKSAKARPQRKLHTITGLSTQRVFTGDFTLAGATYQFTYAPAKGEVKNSRFLLHGKFTVAGAKGRAQSSDGIKAMLVGVQSGLGGGPPRPNSGAAIAAFEQKRAANTMTPIATESTDGTSFTGVMYLHFEGLNGRALGVPADLSHTQLNVRFYIVEDTARALHGIYSSIIDALHHANAEAAAALVEELNRRLIAG